MRALRLCLLKETVPTGQILVNSERKENSETAEKRVKKNSCFFQ